MNKPIDPWELLREARESVERDFDWGEHDATGRQTLLHLLKRIDAALAQREAGIIASQKTDFLRGVRSGICSYCGHPENSTACQRGHP